MASGAVGLREQRHLAVRNFKVRRANCRQILGGSSGSSVFKS
jgi:hypothetical protein